jgi:hypothetical protein
MILPKIRASLSRNDAQQVIGLLGRRDPDLAEAVRLRLEESGIGRPRWMSFQNPVGGRQRENVLRERPT